MKTVVVESPSKAKTINKYLGKDYTVLASFGHVRDLPSKDGSVRPDDDFEMTYVVDDDSKKHVSAIAKALKESDSLILATDPDREGEAIAWHVLEALKSSKALKKNVEVQRVTFEEITKNAVLKSMASPRAIDMDLVNAQQARRALDYLVGFTLSPVLWRKLPGSKSAGRVQSVALRLICERDLEIEQFLSREYWDIKIQFANQKNAEFIARLNEYNGEKLDKFAISNEARANEISESLRNKQYSVKSIEAKQVRRNPYPPFTTSTIQQEASRKLGFGAKKTMQLAQKLYEGVSISGETLGLITYMRTDSVTLSNEAINGARGFIEKKYGKEFLPDAPRMYKTKAKNAQEAHEAIRPTQFDLPPEKVRAVLEDDMFKLYELVWKRTIASQMESAVFDQTSVDIVANDNKAVLRATGSVVAFEGFLTLYQEGRDDEEEEENRRLPALAKDEALTKKEVVPEQHFTEPPPRYSEASLVKKLEELGIGRPSTYASIISVLQERKYVTLDKKRFIAEPLGRIVTAFLTNFFEKYVEYGFTADLENRLDEVSAGERDWKQVLREFWSDFIAKIDESKKLTVSEVLEAVDASISTYLFAIKADGSDARACPVCKTGRLGVKLGRYGAYIGCGNYPECSHKAQIGEVAAGENGDANGLPRTLGVDENGEQVALKKGPYGIYVQAGEGKTPKRASLFKGMVADDITLEIALQLLSMPRLVGKHPDSGEDILAGVGRFGPYLLHQKKYTSLPADESPLTVGINRAVDILAQPKGKSSSSVEVLKDLGEHPEGGKVQVLKGRYGPYIKHGKINATLPKDSEPMEVDLQTAVELLAKKANSPAPKKFKKRA